MLYRLFGDISFALLGQVSNEMVACSRGGIAMARSAGGKDEMM